MMKSPAGDMRNVLFCVAAVVLACLLTVPLVESGVNDDWSYAKSAFETARTGHIVYNGWSAAMLGVQALWGALFVKIFGAHFWAVRLSTLALVPGVLALCYALHRQAGLSARLALFGTLTFGLSPFVIPYAVTFMTDLPGLLPFFAAMIGLGHVARSIHEKQGVTRPLLGWLLFATVASQLGGTIRQVLWGVPVICLLWLIGSRGLWRGRVPEMGILLATVAVNAGLALLGNRWFAAQDYVIGERLWLGLGMMTLISEVSDLQPLGTQLTALVLTSLAMTLPCLFVAFPDMIVRLRNTLSLRKGALYAVCVLLLCGWLYSVIGLSLFYPWLQATVSPLGMWFGTVPIPPGTVDIVTRVPPSPVIWGITVLVFVYLAVLLLLILQSGMRRRTVPTASEETSPVLEMLTVWSVFYILLLVFKWVVPFAFGNFDRYLLGVIPALTIGTLRFVGQEPASRARRVGAALGGAVIVVGALLGIALTHDYFAQTRTLARVADRLVKAGLARTQILAGFEYDGWTQITTTGYYNDIRIYRFLDTYRVPPESLGFDTDYGFWKYTPDIRPEVVLSVMPFPNLEPTGDAPEPFSCWLPPFTRHVYTWRCDPDTLNPFTPLTDKATRDMLAE